MKIIKDKKKKGLPHISYKLTNLDVKLTNLNDRNGKQKVILHKLRPLHRKVLIENPIFKRFWDDEDYGEFVECILRLESRYDDYTKFDDILYIDSIDDEIIVGNKTEILENKKLHKWKCAYCKTDILSKEDDFSPQNFCCKRCGDIYLNRPTIKTTVLESSYKFSEMLKAKIRRRESIMMSYIRENLNK